MKRIIISILTVALVVMMSLVVQGSTINPVDDKGGPVISKSDSARIDTSSIPDDETIQKQNQSKQGAMFMDSVMYAGGIALMLLPLFTMFMYLMARTNHGIFDKLFKWMTFGTLTVTETTAGQLAWRSVLVMIVGGLLTFGLIKSFIVMIYGYFVQWGWL